MKFDIRFNLIFLFFLLFIHSNIHASDGEAGNSSIKRLNEFVELIQSDVNKYPYISVKKFLQNTDEYEEPGEYWISKVKIEKKGLHKILFSTTKFSNEKLYKFGTLKFTLLKLDNNNRDKQHKEIKATLIRKFGTPLWDKMFRNNTMNRTFWKLNETVDSKWSLILVTSDIGKDKGKIEIIYNSNPKKDTNEEG